MPKSASGITRGSASSDGSNRGNGEGSYRGVRTNSHHSDVPIPDPAGSACAAADASGPSMPHLPSTASLRGSPRGSPHHPPTPPGFQNGGRSERASSPAPSHPTVTS